MSSVAPRPDRDRRSVPGGARDARQGTGRLLVGGALIGLGVALVLDRLGVALPLHVLLPVALIVLGAVLLFAPRRGAVWALVAAGVVLATGVAGAGVGAGPATVEQDRFVASEPVERVELTVGAGRVEVDAGADEVAVTRGLRYRGGRPELRLELADGVLRIEASCPGAWLPFVGGCRVDHHLSAPRDVAVAVDTGSGSVTIDGRDGPVTVRTGSGGIALLDVAGDAELRTGSGGVTGERVTSARLEARTGSGGITLAFADAPDDVALRTGSGGVTVQLPEGVYRLDLDTGSGSTAVDGVTDDPAADRRVRVGTGSGSITVTGQDPEP